VAGPYEVLATGSCGGNFTVSIVGSNGQVAATTQVAGPPPVNCNAAYSGQVPIPVSTSNSRLYYLDAQGVIWYLTPGGQTGRATSVPIGDGLRSMFTVSPDDRRIAVVVATFTSNGGPILDPQEHLEAITRIYVEDLNGGTNHVEIFTATSVFTLWPIGWHGGSLVLAKEAACNAQGQICCGPLELHVVDPATGVRRYTVGSPSCNIAGPPSPGGAICQSGGYSYYALDWTGKITSTLKTPAPYSYALLSPDGVNVAFDSVGQHFSSVAGSAQTWPAEVCGWIDSGHVIAIGSGAQPFVIDIAASDLTPIAAPGTCAGAIPGAL
jgi:hypothetical protein